MYIFQVRIARIFNTYGPRMCLDDGRVVSNFVAQVSSFFYCTSIPISYNKATGSCCWHYLIFVSNRCPTCRRWGRSLWQFMGMESRL